MKKDIQSFIIVFLMRAFFIFGFIFMLMPLIITYWIITDHVQEGKMIQAITTIVMSLMISLFSFLMAKKIRIKFFNGR